MENHQLQEQFLAALLEGRLEEVMKAYQRLHEAGVVLPEMEVCPADQVQVMQRPRDSARSLFSGSSQISDEMQRYNGSSS
jgi:hypothetical protein